MPRICLSFLLLFCFILLSGGCHATSDDMLPGGTRIESLDLSGATVSEAVGKIEEWSKDKLAETRILLYNGTEISTSLQDMGLVLDQERVQNDLAQKPGKALSGVWTFEPTKVNQELQGKLDSLRIPAKDATYKLENEKFVIVPEESGRAADLKKLVEEIQKLALNEIPARMEIPAAETPADVTAKDLETIAFDSVVGECGTNFNAGEENRTANLTKAAQAIDGKVLQPGDTFSFNDTVGPRVPETGYAQAKVIKNNEYISGTGGGICQVSSTLYNAVLLSDLEVLERKPHAVAVTYVPPGQDATVDYPDIDFKFKNNTDNLLYLQAGVSSDTLTFRIWGQKADKSVRIERQVEKETGFVTERRADPNLAPGQTVQDQPGAKGMTVGVWKVIRDGAGNEEKKFVSEDVYHSMNRIIRFGQ